MEVSGLMLEGAEIGTKGLRTGLVFVGAIGCLILLFGTAVVVVLAMPSL